MPKKDDVDEDLLTGMSLDDPSEHGGVSMSVPSESSDPLAVILGEAYVQRVESVDQLHDLKRPMAAMELILNRAAERLVTNDCGNFRLEVQKRLEKVSRSQSEMMIARGKGDDVKVRKHALALNRAIDAMKSYCERAVLDLQSEKNFVESAERVARTMSEACKIQLTAANVMSQAEVSQLMTRIISIIVESLPKDASQGVIERIRREIFVNKLSSE